MLPKPKQNAETYHDWIATIALRYSMVGSFNLRRRLYSYSTELKIQPGTHCTYQKPTLKNSRTDCTMFRIGIVIAILMQKQYGDEASWRYLVPLDWIQFLSREWAQFWRKIRPKSTDACNDKQFLGDGWLARKIAWLRKEKKSNQGKWRTKINPWRNEASFVRPCNATHAKINCAA